MKKIVLVLAITFLVSCTDEESAIKTLKNMGFKDIKTNGHSYFSCSEDDFSSTSFAATNSLGNRVQGTVCCGLLFKACTVRF